MEVTEANILVEDKPIDKVSKTVVANRSPAGLTLKHYFSFFILILKD